MNKTIKPFLTFFRDILLLLIGITMLITAFQPFKLWFLIYIGFVPVFFVIFSTRISHLRSIIFSAIVGFLFFWGVMFWLKRFHPAAAPIVSVLSFIPFIVIPVMLGRITELKLSDHNWYLTPVFFTLAEYLHYNSIIPNPFGTIAYTQYSWLTLIQIIDITGIWYLVFLIVLANMVLFKFFLYLLDHKSISVKSFVIPLIFFIVLLGLTLTYGKYRLATIKPDSDKSLTAGVIQTKDSPIESWHENREKHLDDLDRMNESFKLFPPDIMIYPEGTIDDIITFDNEIKLNGNTDLLNRISHLSHIGTNTLVGVVERKMLADGSEGNFNSALLFNREQNLSGVYQKANLVPFSEYYPFPHWFLPAFEKQLLKTTNNMHFKTPEKEQPLLSVETIDGRKIPFSVSICFESTFPGPVRKQVKRGAEFLVVMTNDMWSMTVGGPLQHFVYSRFRAIENRAPLVRVSNGGISAYFNPLGKSFTKLALFKRGTMGVDLEFVKDGGKTFYTRFGEWFLGLMVLPLIIQLNLYIKKKVKNVDSG